MNKTKAERMNLIIHENFIQNKSDFIDVYLVNGIKMTSYIEEVEAGKYLLLKDKSGGAASHVVLWSTIVTINRSAEQGKSKKDLEEEVKMKISCEVNSDHIFLNKVICVYLANGIKLDGLCVAIDNYNYIVLEKNKKEQIIVWHGIATMSLAVNNGELLMSHSSDKKNKILTGFLQELVSVFLKTGIKLTGKLTDFSVSRNVAGDDSDMYVELLEFVLDGKQLVRGQHVSTITKNKKDY